MQSVVVEGVKRTELGKTATAIFRKNAQTPAVVYAAGKENTHFLADERVIASLVFTDKFLIAEITVDGQLRKAIVKEVQFHPVTDKILHVDFLELVPGVAVKADVPLRLTGLAEGVRVGGKLMQKVRKVRIKATPEAMVDEITLDVTPLGLGKSIRVRDILLTEGVEILSSPALPLASVEIPRALRSAQAKDGK